MIKIDVLSDLKKMQREIADIARKQIPFATASALTAMAKKVQAEETAAIGEVFDKPTPFTKKSVGVKAATKVSLQATVYVRDIAASYLAPFEFGGSHFLGAKQGLLVPKDIRLNQYGNLPRNTLARLKSRSDVFVGKVRLKSGHVINGVWQRPPAAAPRAGSKRGQAGKQGRGTAPRAGLKLLIRFEDALPVKERLGYFERATASVNRNMGILFEQALAKAIATARR